MRLKTVIVSGEVLLSLIKGDVCPAVSNVPDDLAIVGGKIEMDGSLRLVCTSKEWPDMEHESIWPPPVFEVVHQRVP